MSSSPVQGAQVVSRVASLLRIVGRKPEGSPLVELVRESGLTRPTVHRLLSSVASERLPLEDIARPSLRRLAEATGESAFFSIRRGAETVCLLREEGSFPVRSFVL